MMTRTDQHAALCDFARRCIQGAWDAALDEGDVQRWAEELGLIHRDTATRSDCEDYNFDGVPGDEIYRFERWLERRTPKAA